jgi:hypothetical protein
VRTTRRESAIRYSRLSSQTCLHFNQIRGKGKASQGDCLTRLPPDSSASPSPPSPSPLALLAAGRCGSALPTRAVSAASPRSRRHACKSASRWPRTDCATRDTCTNTPRRYSSRHTASPRRLASPALRRHSGLT